MKKTSVIAIPGVEARLIRKIRRHFKELGFTKAANGILVPSGLDKESYREMHSHQRSSKLIENKKWIETNSNQLLKYFASGDEIDVKKISPAIEVVRADTWQSSLFRLATYYWRIPISVGYGRRMRFIVWDSHHNKLIGIFALGDAVFNLKARDEHIGWDHHRRAKGLVNLMDAYALGAVPPYNMLLGGKLIASLIQTKEVVREFDNKYKNSRGIISGEMKKPQLVAVTTTSALGRSSIYNRLKIGQDSIFESIGYSSGWGHFHISDELFEDLRDYLNSSEDSYAESHGYGQGPNYRLRVIKHAFTKLGMNPDLARHGLAREIFFSSLAKNSLQILRGESSKADYQDLVTVEERSKLAIARWVIPRSERMTDYKKWRSEDFLKELYVPPTNIDVRAIKIG